jgi:hypothetical protein
MIPWGGGLLFGQSPRSANGAALVRNEWETGINDRTRSDFDEF